MNSCRSCCFRLGLVLLTLGTFSGSASAAAKPDPKMLVTASEASALLGGNVTLTVHDMEKVYPGSVDFAYETKGGQILSVQVDPLDGPEKLANMGRDLAAAHPGRPAGRCSVGDKCFVRGEDIFATKGHWYIHLSAGRQNAGQIEELARLVASRLP
jgi:hypothetical protein